MNIKIKNPIIQIASGSEFKKINIKIFKKLNLYGIIAEKQFIPKNMNFKGKLLESDSVALNPVLLSGLAVLKNNFKKLNFAFFDGNPQSKKDRIVMEETEEAVKDLSKKGLKMVSLTKSYLPLKTKNLWLN